MTKYLVQYEQHLYPYEREDLLRIAIFENAREGVVADGLWKLEGHGLSYRYVPIDQDELIPKAEPQLQTFEGVAA